jgi:hypothetical protein
MSVGSISCIRGFLSYKFNDILRDAMPRLPNYMITDKRVVGIC